MSDPERGRPEPAPVGGGSARRRRERRWRELGLPIAVGLAAVLGLALLAGPAGRMPPCAGTYTVVDLELAGTAERATRILGPCAPAELGVVRDALRVDTAVFIPLYVATIAFWNLLGLRRLPPRTPAGRSLLIAGVVAAPLAGAFDVVENAALARLADRAGASDAAAAVALAAAVPKWALVLFGSLLAVRTLGRGASQLVLGSRVPDGSRHLRVSSGADAWSRAMDVPNPDAGRVGIALSGGGIRSASFCMGGTQVLSEAAWPDRDNAEGQGDDSDDSDEGDEVSVLGRARWLSAVSGGGYLAGSRQLLLAQGVAAPFAAGSHEVDHVRRHGRYLADSASEWVTGGARALAGLLLNLVVLGMLLWVVARPIGWVHAAVFEQRELRAGDVGLTAPMATAVLLPLAVAALFLVAAVMARPKGDTAVPPGRWELLWWVAGLAAAATVVSAAVVVVAPLAGALSYRVLELGEEGAGLRQAGAAGGVTLLTALLTLARVKAPSRATFERWLRRAAERDEADDTGGPPRPARFPRLGTLARRLGGVVLALVVVVLFASIVQEASRRGTTTRELVVYGAAVGVLVVLYLLADQTSWSLHPVYKRRLASAFAIARESDAATELPYDQPTPLAALARRPGRPEVVLCAAANVSGPHVAPPGRRAVTYTFGDGWVGGPQVGYVTRPAYEWAFLGPNRGDATLLAAMAVSGAAFASAMGRHSRGSLGALMAVANLRLGVWLPSPAHAADVASGAGRRILTRPFTYLLREIAGVYDHRDRFLHVTDGGHYENLGLVELLRRRCKVVLCLDASGGPATLLEAVRLAWEELGVEVAFEPGDLDRVRTHAEATRLRATGGAGGGEGGEADPLEARLAETEVLVGRIRYPGDDEPGTLVYGRAVLTSGTPELVRRYARERVLFPNDPTGDQWFDVEQFNHYLLLGRHVARRIVEALAEVLLGGQEPT